MHWYGKREVAAQRKVGHVTIVAPDAATAHRNLAAIDARAEALLSATLVATPGAQTHGVDWVLNRSLGCGWSDVRHVVVGVLGLCIKPF